MAQLSVASGYTETVSVQDKTSPKFDNVFMLLPLLHPIKTLTTDIQ
jgi:hypothetical protein